MPDSGRIAPSQRFPASRHVSGVLCKAHKVYSLTCDEYEALWERSGGRCEACGRAFDLAKRDHAIDHDHRYGYKAVRGIVCVRCNGYLARLETPRLHPTFGSGPGRWFADYFRRAWFVRSHHSSPPPTSKLVDHDKFRAEMRDWSAHNKHLFTRDPKATVVPTDKPSEIAKILRAEMSPQAFASLVRILNREAQIPKRTGVAITDGATHVP